jgi:hypothetical protein
MVSGRGVVPLVTGVMEIQSGKSSGSVGQHDAKLAQNQPLIVGHDQEFESAAEAFVIADDGAQPDDVGREGDGEIQGNDLARLQLTAECGADAVLSKFVGAAPENRGAAFTKDGRLDAGIEAIASKAPQTALRLGFGCGLGVVGQSGISGGDLCFLFLESGFELASPGDETCSLCDCASGGRFRSTASKAMY